jgi:hypothetical protein
MQKINTKYCADCSYKDNPSTAEPCYSCLSDTKKTGEPTGFLLRPELCHGNCSTCTERRCIPFKKTGGPKITHEAQEGVKINDPVEHPGHYTRLPIEAIKAIELLVTEVYGKSGWEAFCFGSELKYRLRAGFKGDATEDIGKALKYEKFRNNNFE